MAANPNTAEHDYKVASDAALADFQDDKIGFAEWNRRQKEAVAAYDNAVAGISGSTDARLAL